MTAAHNSGPLRPVSSLCTGLIDCAGARISAYDRGQITVLVVDGEIDMCNAADIGKAIRHLYGMKNPLILDLSPVAFIAVSGFRELLTFAEECGRTGVDWSVVAGNALRPLLRVFTDHRLPVADSIGEALGTA